MKNKKRYISNKTALFIYLIIIPVIALTSYLFFGMLVFWWIVCFLAAIIIPFTGYE